MLSSCRFSVVWSVDYLLDIGISWPQLVSTEYVENADCGAGFGAFDNLENCVFAVVQTSLWLGEPSADSSSIDLVDGSIFSVIFHNLWWISTKLNTSTNFQPIPIYISENSRYFHFPIMTNQPHLWNCLLLNWNNDQIEEKLENIRFEQKILFSVQSSRKYEISIIPICISSTVECDNLQF